MPPNPFARDPAVTVGISGSSASMNRAAESAKDNLGELGRSAQVAGGRLESFGDEVTQATARTSAFAGATGAAATSTSAFGAAAQASAIPAAGALLSTLSPLAAVAGTLAAAVGSLAGAFGTVLGSGILAFGEKRAEQNKEQLLRVRDQIEELENLKDEQGELTDQQRLRLRQLEEREDKLDDATSALGAFKLALEDVASEVAPIITQFGEQFVPLIEDALDAVPDLVERMFAATGSMQAFKDALRDFGGAAFQIIPQVFGAMFDLARRALPVLRDVFETVAAQGGQAFQGMLAVTTELAPELQNLLDALVGLARPLTRFGVTVLEVALPALTRLIRITTRALQRFNEMDGRIRRVAAAGLVLAPVVFKAASALSTLSSNIGAVSTALSALTGPLGVAVAAVAAFAGAYITNFGGIRDATNDVLRILRRLVTEVVQGFVEPAVRRLAEVWRLHFDEIVAETRETVQVLLAVGRRFGQQFNAFWQEWGDEITAIARAAWDLIITLTETQLDVMLTAIRVVLNIIQGDWGEAWAAIRGLVDRTLSRIITLVRKWAPVAKSAVGDAVGATADAAEFALQWFTTEGVTLIKDLVRLAVDWLRTTGVSMAERAARGVADAVQGALEDLGEAAISWGQSVVEGLIQGLRNKLGELREAAEQVAGVIDKHMPGSDAETGPLSDLSASGAAIPETLAAGMQRNQQAVAPASDLIPGGEDSAGGGPRAQELRRAVADGVSEADVGAGESVVIEVDGRRLAEATRESKQRHVDNHLVTK